MSALLLLGLRILAAAALYAFMIWALVLIWRSTRQEADFLSARKITPLWLQIQEPGREARLVQFTQGDILIGRDPDCECPLQDPAASARHARLHHHHNQWWLEDVQSTNGTRLNEETLQTPAVIVAEDLIECGQTRLTVQFTPPEETP